MHDKPCQYNFIFTKIKNEVGYRAYSPLPFTLFSSKKSAADAHRIICETYKNVIAIRERMQLMI